MSTQSLQRRQPQALARTDEVGAADVATVINRIALIQQCMKQLMKEGTHYGKIPGVAKNSLFKPGAELLNTAFQFAATYPPERISRVLEKEFVCYEVTCCLVHIPTGRVVGEGVGLCSSREDKYAYRRGSIACPNCQKETIIKGKAEYGGGWLCYKPKGGCGQKWKDENAFDPKQAEKIPNPNLWEQANTILKMAEKRAMVAATLNATGASDIFTQDIEDFVDIPNQSGWNGSGSQAAAQAVADAKIADLSPDPAVDIAEDPLPPVDATTGSPASPQATPRPCADPRKGAYLYREQAEDLKSFAKAKKVVGELAYRNALTSHGVERSLQFQSHAEAEKCLNTLRECAAAQKAQKKLEADRQMDSASLPCHRAGSGCDIVTANQIAAAVKKLDTPHAEACMTLETMFKDRKVEFPDSPDIDHWRVLLMGLEETIKRQTKES